MHLSPSTSSSRARRPYGIFGVDGRLRVRDAAGASGVAGAAHRRLRPVRMTTAAGIAALAPLALGRGSGSDLLRPLALAVVGGFMNSAPLLRIVLPALPAKTAPASD